MASFAHSYAIVRKSEGGYVSAATAASINDKGGETYKGVARNFNPNWAGWSIIDEYKRNYGIPKYNSVIKNSTLDNLVTDLFKKSYWNIFSLDKLNNQSLADFIFDYSINGGQGNTTNALKKATGVPRDFVTVINKSVNKKAIFESLKQSRVDNINAKKDSFDAQLLKRTNDFFFVEG